jgi:hypothetical protein
MKQTKAQIILSLLEKGYSIRAITLKAKCTKNYVYMIKRQRDKAALLQAEQMRQAYDQITYIAPPVSLWQRIKNFFKG